MRRMLCAVTAAATFFVLTAVTLRAGEVEEGDNWRYELAETGKNRTAVTVEIINGGALSRTDTGTDVDWRGFSGLAFTFAKGIPWWGDAAPSISIGWSTFGATGLQESGGNGDAADSSVHPKLRAINGEFLEAGFEIPLFSSKVFRRKGDRWGEPWRPYFLVAYMDGKVWVVTQKGPDVPFAEANRSDINERIVHAHGMKYGFALSFSEVTSLVLSGRLIRAPFGIMRDISLFSFGIQMNFY